MKKQRHVWYDDEPLVTIFELMARISEGAQGSGVHLTANECNILASKRTLLEEVLGPKPKRGRPSRSSHIALACIVRSWHMPMKAAVKDTVRQFGCSEATVYNAVSALKNPR
jgi:hypothetical protein